MNRMIVLDSSILGKLVHPRQVLDIYQWFQGLLEKEYPVVIPEIVDYELRRNLLHKDFIKSIERLDLLKETLIYLPLNTDTMLRAAELWALARKQGKPTADYKSLDCDVILAAQTLQVNGIVVTENVKHLSLFVETRLWHQIS